MAIVSARDLANDRSPRQVMFWDGENYCAGIMVGKILICGCCGGTFDLDEVLENAKEAGVVAVKAFETWVDICEEIEGDGSNAIDLEFEEV